MRERVEGLHLRASGASARAALDVDSIGHLVPRGRFSGHVHSVFAHACNLACTDMLLSLVAPHVGDGPTTLLLRRAPQDLRHCFRAGAAFECDGAVLRSGHTVVNLGAARIWNPAARRPKLAPAEIAAHLQRTAAFLAERRSALPSVIDGAAAATIETLVHASVTMDRRTALPALERLVGWGEGLTPAGDDFLVGFLAALEMLVHDAAHEAFLGELRAAIAPLTHRTTDVAAHFLRLASRGHYVDAVEGLRDALLCEHRCALVKQAVQRTLEIGATSGADIVSGMLAGVRAWLQERSGTA